MVTTSRSETILREAYKEAVLLFSKELRQDQHKVPWLFGAQSMDDFRKVVMDAEN